MGASSSNIAALRAKHAAVSGAGKHAVVAGGTSGIGRGAALRLAQAGYSVTLLGRDGAAAAAALAAMRAAGPPGASATHAGVACDAFRLAAVREAAAAVSASLGGAPLDVLFLSQGMATVQGFTPTADGLDQKLALHVYSRVLLARELLPALRRAPTPAVVSVLSAGVHSPYAHWKDDPDVRAHYSLSNAADAAGLFNDVALDALSRQNGNEQVLFIHAAPGVVATNWGSEMPLYIRAPLRALQAVAPLRSPADCAEAMLAPVFDAAAGGGGGRGGFRLIGPDAQPAAKTAVHDEAREALWPHLNAVIDRVLAAGKA